MSKEPRVTRFTGTLVLLEGHTKSVLPEELYELALDIIDVKYNHVVENLKERIEILEVELQRMKP